MTAFDPMRPFGWMELKPQSSNLVSETLASVMQPPVMPSMMKTIEHNCVFDELHPNGLKHNFADSLDLHLTDIFNVVKFLIGRIGELSHRNHTARTQALNYGFG